MTAQSELSTAAADFETRPAGIGKPTLIGRVNVLLILTAIVALECIVVFLIVPNPSQFSAQADPPDSRKESITSQEPLPPEGFTPDDPVNPDLARYVEIDMKEFTITARQPGTNTTLRLDFHLYGTVERSKQSEVETLFREREVRIRDQIRTIFLESDTQDLTDPLLGLIKRKVLEKTNRILGDRYLKSVAFSDFNFVEQ